MEELFEARNPKYFAEIAPYEGKIIDVESEGSEVTLTFEALDKQTREYYVTDSTMAFMVKKGDTVEEKQIIAKSKESRQKIQVGHAGRVMKVTDDMIVIEDLIPEIRSFIIPAGRNILAKTGDVMRIGAKLTEGHVNLQSLMDTAGPLSTELYIVSDIKEIYSSQGQTVNAKHIELIVRQMFSKVKITNAGDSSFFP